MVNMKSKKQLNIIKHKNINDEKCTDLLNKVNNIESINNKGNDIFKKIIWNLLKNIKKF